MLTHRARSLVTVLVAASVVPTFTVAFVSADTLSDIKYTDLLARLFQHEVDHLNGVLLLDMLDQQEKDSLMHEYYARNSKDANKLS